MRHEATPRLQLDSAERRCTVISVCGVESAVERRVRPLHCEERSQYLLTAPATRLTTQIAVHRICTLQYVPHFAITVNVGQFMLCYATTGFVRLRSFSPNCSHSSRTAASQRQSIEDSCNQPALTHPLSTSQRTTRSSLYGALTRSLFISVSSIHQSPSAHCIA